MNPEDTYTHKCAGVIVYNDKQQVVVVKTPAGNHSFPKGKREKGENIKQTAFRELYEEAGFNEDEVKLDSNKLIIEYNQKGIKSVYFYMGKSNKENVQPTDLDHPDELEETRWIDYKELLKIKCKDSRVIFFKQIHDIFKIKFSHKTHQLG